MANNAYAYGTAVDIGIAVPKAGGAELTNVAAEPLERFAAESKMLPAVSATVDWAEKDVDENNVTVPVAMELSLAPVPPMSEYMDFSLDFT